jgi:rRNA maturation RNase YbeY
MVTDVLSFAADNDSVFDRARSGRGASVGHPRPPLYLGDIVIARGIAGRQARQAGHSSDTEFRVLALHGLLHLLGYDHEADGDNGRMARLEARLRRKGGLREGLLDRADKLAGVGPRARKRLRPAGAAGGERDNVATATARRAGVGPRSHKKRLRPAGAAGGQRDNVAPATARRAGVGPRSHKK